MSMKKSWWTILLSMLGLASLLTLSAGLGNIEFSFGEFIEFPRMPNSGQISSIPSIGGDLLGNMLLVFLTIAQLCLPYAIIYFLLSKEARRKVLRSLASLLWLIALFILIRRRADLFDRSNPDLPTIPSQGMDSFAANALSPHATDSFVLILTILLAGFLTLGLFTGLGMLWKRRQVSATPLDRLAEEAQHALQAIKDGKALRDTVMRCYFEMAQVLREERGIARATAMTPREFQQRLLAEGLPGEAVQDLTRLFEIVRYSSSPPGEEEGERACACLAAIIDSVRGVA